MYCNNCGHRNPLGANFCSSCGAVLSSAGADPTTITFQLDAVPGTDEFAVELDDQDTGGVLVVTRGPNVGSRYSLDKDLVTAGRHPDSDIFLDDVTVSRNHVELRRQSDNSYRVRDVGSLNGTYLNRELIEEALLQNGDELQIGKFKLVYVDGGRGDEAGNGGATS